MFPGSHAVSPIQPAPSAMQSTIASGTVLGASRVEATARSSTTGCDLCWSVLCSAAATLSQPQLTTRLDAPGQAAGVQFLPLALSCVGQRRQPRKWQTSPTPEPSTGPRLGRSSILISWATCLSLALLCLVALLLLQRPEAQVFSVVSFLALMKQTRTVTRSLTFVLILLRHEHVLSPSQGRPLRPIKRANDNKFVSFKPGARRTDMQTDRDG